MEMYVKDIVYNIYNIHIVYNIHKYSTHWRSQTRFMSFKNQVV